MTKKSIKLSKDFKGIFSISVIHVFQIDIIRSLLSGRLVREKVGPAVQSAVQSQVHTCSPMIEFCLSWEIDLKLMFMACLMII